MDSVNFEQIKSTDRKWIKNEFTTCIQTNNIESLEGLLSDETRLSLLKREKYLNPFVIAIRSNNLQIFDFLIKNGFKLVNTENLRINNKNQKRKDKRKYDDYDQDSASFKEKSTESDSESDIEFTNTLLNPLTEAIKCFNFDAVQLLVIGLGFSVNSNNYKMIPLQVSYNLYSAQRDKLLLKENIDVNKYQVSF